MWRGNDRGQATPLLVLVLLMAIGVAVVLAHLGRIVALRAQAQTAADAAALAGVIEGPEGAAELARANGAAIVSFEVDESEVQVVVEIGPTRARARARRDQPR